MGCVGYVRYLPVPRWPSMGRILMYIRQEGTSFVVRSAHRPPKSMNRFSAPAPLLLRRDKHETENRPQVNGGRTHTTNSPHQGTPQGNIG